MTEKKTKREYLKELIDAEKAEKVMDKKKAYFKLK